MRSSIDALFAICIRAKEGIFVQMGIFASDYESGCNAGR